PHIVADVHRQRELQSTAALVGVQGMGGRVDVHARTKQNVIADVHFGGVQHNAVEVEKDPASQVDIAAVIAEKGRLDHNLVAHGAEKFSIEGTPGIGIPVVR